MNAKLTLSPAMRIVAVVGVFLVAVAAAALLLVPRKSSDTNTVAPPARPAVAARPVQHVARKPAPAVHAGTSIPVPKATGARPAPIPVKPRQPVVQLVGGLPPVVAAALRKHAVVVVSLVTPRSTVDSIAEQEASQGAALAGVAWIRLNVLDERQTRPLITTFAVLQDPGVLVFRRPGTVIARFDGFADRDLVAQAAANAK